jgi:hypothetical protein
METDPSGNDLADVTFAAGIGAGIDAFVGTAIVGVEVSAETTVEATEVAEVTETAVAEGESTAAANEKAAKQPWMRKAHAEKSHRKSCNSHRKCAVIRIPGISSAANKSFICTSQN